MTIEDLLERFLGDDGLDAKLERILERQDLIMATLADLDAAIAAQATEVATLQAAVAKVDNDIATLLGKLQAGGAVDVTAELQAIQNTTQNIANAVSAAQAADATMPVAATTVPTSVATAPVSHAP